MGEKRNVFVLFRSSSQKIFMSNHSLFNRDIHIRVRERDAILLTLFNCDLFPVLVATRHFSSSSFLLPQRHDTHFLTLLVLLSYLRTSIFSSLSFFLSQLGNIDRTKEKTDELRSRCFISSMPFAFLLARCQWTFYRTFPNSKSP